MIRCLVIAYNSSENAELRRYLFLSKLEYETTGYYYADTNVYKVWFCEDQKEHFDWLYDRFVMKVL